MNYTLQYNDFKDKPVYEKIDLMDSFKDFIYLEEIIEPKVYTNYLSQIFEHETNNYVRKKCADNLIYLAFEGKIRSTFIQNFLLDIQNNDDLFILILKAKYLYYFYSGEQEVIATLNSLSECDYGDVVGEAYFRLGLIEFFKINDNVETLEIITILKEALIYFNHSLNSNENRIDAQFYADSTIFLINCIEKSDNTIVLDRLSQNLFQRKVYGFNNQFPFIDTCIYQSFLRINSLFSSVKNESNWIDFTKEFSNLSSLFHEFLAFEVTNNYIDKSKFEKLKSTIKDAFINPYFRTNLAATQNRIETIISQITDESVIAFLKDLSLTISSNQEKKKSWENNSTIIQLAKILPNKSFDELQNINYENGIDEILGYITEEFNNIKIPQPAYLTGYSNTEEILLTIIRKVKNVLPNYPLLKLESIKIVVSDIIRYVYNTFTMDKSLFPELFDPNEKQEKTFQNSLFKNLKHSLNCRFYLYENSVVGRVDIFFKDDNISIPIEVKKTEKIIDFESIKKNYIAQAQTYAQPYDQIGFLIVFDISKKTKPINSLSSLFELITIEPEYNLNNGMFDYIIVAIVPANKQLPSSMTTY